MNYNCREHYDYDRENKIQYPSFIHLLSKVQHNSLEYQTQLGSLSIQKDNWLYKEPITCFHLCQYRTTDLVTKKETLTWISIKELIACRFCFLYCYCCILIQLCLVIWYRGSLPYATFGTGKNSQKPKIALGRYLANEMFGWFISLQLFGLCFFWAIIFHFGPQIAQKLQ